MLGLGWLNVRIPGAGATAGRHLIDVLGADVFVAGTYKPDDCVSRDPDDVCFDGCAT